MFFGFLAFWRLHRIRQSLREFATQTIQAFLRIWGRPVAPSEGKAGHGFPTTGDRCQQTIRRGQLLKEIDDRTGRTEGAGNRERDEAEIQDHGLHGILNTRRSLNDLGHIHEHHGGEVGTAAIV